MPNYYVEFCYVDGCKDTYWYHNSEDAINHAELFRGDDSGLYESIKVWNYESDKLLSEIRF